MIIPSELLSRNRIKSLIENQCVEKDEKVITSPSVKTISNSKYRIHVPPPISAKPEPQKYSFRHNLRRPRHNSCK